MRRANTSRRRIRFFVLIGLASLALGFSALPVMLGRAPDDTAPKAPPVAPVRPVSEEYFGVKVVDPYRYMENMKDPEVTAWFKAQNDYTRAVLSRISGREALLAEIKRFDESAPARVSDIRRLPSGRYFYQKRLASEDVSKIYMRDGLNGEEKLLVDPLTFARSGGPYYSISYYAPSFDGRYVAFGVSPAGSEDAVLYVLDTSTGKKPVT
jgi:prolyl oligopeptidase